MSVLGLQKLDTQSESKPEDCVPVPSETICIGALGKSEVFELPDSVPKVAPELLFEMSSN